MEALLISCARATHGLGRPSPGLMVRLCVPVGGRVKKLCAVGEQSSQPSREQMEERWPLDARNEGQSGRFSFVRTVEYQGVVDYLTPLKYRNCF